MANKKAAAIEQRAGKPTDPVFLTLVEHSIAIRTKLSIEALGQLHKKLGADSMRVGIHGTETVSVSFRIGKRHYSAWYYPDEVYVESFEIEVDEYGEKSYTDIDKYNSRDGVTMANGHKKGGE